MNIRNVAAIVAMILVAVLSVVYMTAIGLPVGRDIGVRTASLTVQQTSGLVPGSKVLYRGVEIGWVTGVDPSLAGVTVSWKYRDEYRIPADATFRVDNLSALGETYLSVVPTDGSIIGDVLADGATLSPGQVEVPTTVDELSARVVGLLAQVHSADIDVIVEAMNTGLIGDRSVLANLGKGAALLERTIVSTRAPLEVLLDKFPELLVNGSQVSGALASSREGLTAFGDEFKKFLDWCVTFIVEDNLPTELTDGAGPFLEQALAALNRAAPDIKVLGDAGLPAVEQATGRLKHVDLSQLLTTALATAGSGDGVVIRVGGR